MSLFDALKDQIGGMLGHSAEEKAAAANPSFVAGVLEMLQKQGLKALSERFKEHGLGDIIHSWVGKGENLPISADMIHKVFSPEAIEALAQKAGIPAGQVSSLLAKVLPTIIDKLTPHGLLEEPAAAP